MATTPRITSKAGLFGSNATMAAKFDALYGMLWRYGIVDPATKELTRLRNARVTGCDV